MTVALADVVLLAPMIAAQPVNCRADTDASRLR